MTPPDPTPAEIAARPIPGYEGHYCAAQDGKILSVERTFGRKGYSVRVPARELKQCFNRNGYPFVRLNKKNQARTFEVHVLVALTFLGPRPFGLQVAHLDGDKRNPSASNLNYVTPRQNNLHRFGHGTVPIGDCHPQAKISAADARSVILFVLDGASKRHAAREFGISESAVRKILKGALRAHDTLAVRAVLEQEARDE